MKNRALSHWTWMAILSLFWVGGCLGFVAPSSRYCSGPTTAKLERKASSTDTTTTASSTNEYSAKEKVSFKFFTMENGMCPYAARTWITLLELDLPFETIGVSPMKKEEWYLKINPNNKVPAIQNTVDGSVIYESAICNEYLVDLARELDSTNNKDIHAHKDFWKLMPVSAADRAALRLLNDHIDNQLCTAQFTFLMNDDSEKDAEMMSALESAMETLQHSLVTRGGPFLMGREFSLADIHVLPFFLRLVISLEHFKNYKIPNERFSRLLEWFDLCSQRPSVQAASKSKDEIIQVYQKFVDMKYGFGGLNKNK